jgi:hypothetical protein
MFTFPMALFAPESAPPPSGSPPVSGYILWLDASDAASLTLSGSNVSAWAVRSANSNNATQGTSGSQPTYNATAQNSMGGIVFQGAQVLNLPLGNAGSTASIYAVVKGQERSYVFRGLPRLRGIFTNHFSSDGRRITSASNAFISPGVSLTPVA